jgi:hypothetical protein
MALGSSELLIMCKCVELPDVVADPTYSDCTFHFEGLEKHGIYFQELETESLEPTLDRYPRVYRCRSCQQWWYVECTPEDTISPLFAMKCKSESTPSASEILGHKNRLCVLAHGGHESSPCRISGCTNLKLRGREICELHCQIF